MKGNMQELKEARDWFVNQFNEDELAHAYENVFSMACREGLGIPDYISGVFLQKGRSLSAQAVLTLMAVLWVHFNSR